MAESMNTPFGQPVGERPERPPNYLVRAIILLVVLLPLCLLLGGSSLFAAWSILTGPTVISEIPVWMRALMQLLRVVVASISFFMPIMALVQALKVNREFDAGNYGGAAAASRLAGKYCRQSLIFVVLIILIMAVDLLNYFTSRKN
jgi:hypothetical protein